MVKKQSVALLSITLLSAVTMYAPIREYQSVQPSRSQAALVDAMMSSPAPTGVSRHTGPIREMATAPAQVASTHTGPIRQSSVYAASAQQNGHAVMASDMDMVPLSAANQAAVHNIAITEGVNIAGYLATNNITLVSMENVATAYAAITNGGDLANDYPVVVSDAATQAFFLGEIQGFLDLGKIIKMVKGAAETAAPETVASATSTGPIRENRGQATVASSASTGRGTGPIRMSSRGQARSAATQSGARNTRRRTGPIAAR